MGGPKGPKRGKKTHRADQLLNRGEHMEPQDKEQHRGTGDWDEGRRAESWHEHPTGRKTERGHRAGQRRGYRR
ncbi:MAG: hypothetical protein ACT443_04880 [Gemmatimonadota bacterium]